MTQPGDGVSPTLLAAARRGEPLAVRRLVERSYPAVRRWALVQLGDPDDADDLTQDVMIRMIGRLAGFRGDSAFESWLYAMTRNAAHDARRRTARARAAREDPRVRAEISPPTPRDPSAHVEAAEARTLVRALWAELPERQREVFDLVELQGRPAAEAAELLGIEPVSVRAHLFKARRTMRGRMLEGRTLKEESA